LIQAYLGGDRAGRGSDYLAVEGLLRRVIAGRWDFAPALGRMALEGEIEAYSWPAGVIHQLFRATAAKRPGLMSRIGLASLADPGNGGGSLNSRTTEELVAMHRYRGREYLFFPTIPIQCAVIRASGVDGAGNLFLDREAFPQAQLVLAQAARTAGGIVIAQAARRLTGDEADTKWPAVPAHLVDYVVLADIGDHWQTYDDVHNPIYLSRRSESHDPVQEHLDARTVIARRAARIVGHLDGGTAYFGQGLPEHVAALLRVGGQDRLVALTETGLVGGAAASGLSFGASMFPTAVMDPAAQFDFFEGGGLDVAILAVGQVDGEGSVNTCLLGDNLIGLGAANHVAETASMVIYCGAFAGDGLETVIRDGRLEIIREGNAPRFVETLEALSVHGPSLAARGQRGVYVTERAVLTLDAGQPTVIELAPGADLQRDVLSRAGPPLAVAQDLAQMDPALFS
jgi:propionate CoA-transferase